MSIPRLFDAELLRSTPDGDECPLCENGTVEVEYGEVRCRGECGVCVLLLDRVYPNDLQFE